MDLETSRTNRNSSSLRLLIKIYGFYKWVKSESFKRIEIYIEDNNVNVPSKEEKSGRLNFMTIHGKVILEGGLEKLNIVGKIEVYIMKDLE